MQLLQVGTGVDREIAGRLALCIVRLKTSAACVRYRCSLERRLSRRQSALTAYV